MARYGSGDTTTSGYSVYPFTIRQSSFDSLTLDWKNPGLVWTNLRIVKNIKGYPVNENDGTIVVDITPATAISEYIDNNVAAGRYYYYAAFIGAAPAAWDGTINYLQNELVSVGGTNYRALSNNLGQAPASSPTIWTGISTATQWRRAEGISSIPVKDTGYQDFVYGMVPRAYKDSIEVPTDDLTNTNVDLKNFTNIFAYHMDMVRTEYDALFSINDADSVFQGLLPNMASQLGVTLEPYVSPRLARLRTKTASFVHRQRGSFQGLRNIINSTTGWDVVIDSGANLMLNSDQAAFDNPQYLAWDVNTNYPIGSLVAYNSRVYVCILGAYGLTNAPTGGASNNTWWNNVAALSTPTYVGPWSATQIYGIGTWVLYNSIYYKCLINATLGTAPTGLATSNANWQNQTVPSVVSYGNLDTGSVGTWGHVSFTGGTTASPQWLTLVAGSQDPIFSGVNTGNVLKVSNTGQGTADIGARSLTYKIGATTPDRGQVTKDGVPVASPLVWSPSVLYSLADQVVYKGIIYLCLADNQNVAPDSHPLAGVATNVSWLALYPEFSLTYAVSGYALVSSGASAFASMFLDVFDEDGLLIDRIIPPTNLSVYDDYFITQPLTSSTFTPDGNHVYVAFNGSTWQAGHGVAYTDPTAGGQPANRMLLVESGNVYSRANATIGVTFRSAPATGYQHGIVFRQTDASNFWYATRDRLVKTVAGTQTIVATWTPLVDNDRILVTTNGSAITVYSYGLKTTSAAFVLNTLANISDGFNVTAHAYGLFERNVTP